jgi:hypothetical protein
LRDEFKTEDVFFASYLHYNGLPVLKVINYDRTSPVWMFSVPSCDIQIMRDEFANKEQAIYVEAFVNSIKHVQRFASLARQHGGEFLTKAYREALGI